MGVVEPGDVRVLLEGFRRDLVLRDLPGWSGGSNVFQFRFDQEEPLHLIVQDRSHHFEEGLHPAPDITLFLDTHATLDALLRGRLAGMDAFMSGRYRSDGNIVLSQLLLYLFAEAPTADFTG